MNQPNRSKSPLSHQSSSFNSERFICGLLFIIGLVGLQRILISSPKLSPSVYQPSTLVTHPEPTPIETKLAQLTSTPPRGSSKEMLQINGDFEAAEVLTFHLPDFHSKVSYELVMGNEDTLQVSHPTFYYTYTKSGRYTLQLWGIYHQERKLLYSRKIRINESIEVAEHAFVDMED